MRKVTIKVFTFDELGETAKQKALDEYRSDEDHSHIHQEVDVTYSKFCEIFGLEIESYTESKGYVIQYSDSIIWELHGQRLVRYLWNNYKNYLFKGKYYGKLVKTFKDGSPIPVSKEHPNGTRHVKRYSKCILNNDCVLTGTCWDMDLLDPIYKFLDAPEEGVPFILLIRRCVESLVKSVNSEIEARNSDEYISEHFEVNNYEFTEDGKRYYI